MSELRGDYEPMPAGYRDDVYLTAGGEGVSYATLDGYLVETPVGLHAKLEHVEVDDAHRGQGVGTELVRQFASRAAAAGAVSLSALVTSLHMARIMGRVFGPATW